MPSSRLEEIRLKEKLYHDEFYENVKLFTQDTWLQKPVKTVMDTYELLTGKDNAQLLDLGCGVGRNSIPLAQRLEGNEGKVVCVDFLESAIRHLRVNAEQFGVADKLELIQSDISELHINAGSYDYIISVSALEHLDSISSFHRVLETLQHGTKEQGIHCFIINANVQETEIDTGIPLHPMFELLFRTEELIRTLRDKYADWTILRESAARFSLEIQRDEKRVLLQSDVVTWIARKS
ncbi:class I SAM-dependent methyltransferase [Paenibacillus albus]|uniref:Class I SAM-dependent methyltransferase n=1 Tax=Paenibacillus albus TaxID=2495582 RepID=A0A3S9A2C6_9BACL|nr:class I SAM-dependent methyltransferase [Paenibacillus albus]AZN39855.1 class I SAM-dependent methyltransferase [Paenibacillus albus]